MNRKTKNYAHLIRITMTFLFVMFMLMPIRAGAALTAEWSAHLAHCPVLQWQMPSFASIRTNA